MEKSSPCFSTAQLLRHLVGLGRRGRKALVRSGSLGLRRASGRMAARQRCYAAVEVGTACLCWHRQRYKLWFPGLSFCYGKSASTLVCPLLPCGAPVLGTLLCLKETVGTVGGGQALSGLLAEEIHPSAVPGVETWGGCFLRL